MPADPKPIARPPRTPKRLRRKAKHPKRYKSPRCDIRGCKRKAEIRETYDEAADTGRPHMHIGLVRLWCRSHARIEADRLCGQIVRARGTCEVCGAVATDWAHGFSRRYLAVRWNPLNGFALCRKCHLRMTYNPLLWDDFLRERWGQTVYDELRRIALTSTEPPDYAAILAQLRSS